MAKQHLSQEVRATFSERLNEVLDRRGFPKKGRASRLGEQYGVTTTAASAWLKGSLPTMDMLIQICKDFDVSVSWLTGSPGDIPMADTRNLSRSVEVINKLLRDHNLFDSKVDDAKLALLYAMAYRRFLSGQNVVAEELEDHVRLVS